ncbi:MAG TPA: multicopper oxidase family protein [Nocardioidaceae bacterium]
MKPISRRAALVMGGVGVTSAVVGGFGLVRELRPSLDVDTGAAFREPEVLRSEGGSLSVTLEAAPGRHVVAGREADVLAFNGGLPGPTLVLRPGDRLQIRLVNNLDQVTNLHVHGMHVSPSDNADNVFIEIGPGETFDYDYRLPQEHPPGVYWYHPHRHHLVADQLFRGLFGAIVVEDPEALDVAAERLLVVSDTTLDASGEVVPPSFQQRMMGREGELVLVNGQAVPQIDARTGERERWRVVNACSSRFLSLRLDGHQVHLLGIDSGRFAEPVPTEQLLLAPGNRGDLLVTVGKGDGVLRAVPFDRGGMGMMGGMGPGSGDGGPVRLATLSVTGDAQAAAGPLPTFDAPADLRDAEVARRRRLVFAMGMGGGGMSFTIDGKVFDPDRTDQGVSFGDVEEWTILNDSPMDHPFHLHVWPMQVVVDGDGNEPERPTWQDVVNVPARSGVRVRVAFERFDGRTVYHCHILDHEDLGMMGVVEVS